ncbi:hypothetical protein PF010_g7445 [Phytophthora fragariae]|uniref:Uncharacterized protein n=2 Tax=Phytophthora fragariae TaxID=53985 RepID=A0A6A3F823_9STRA|nr:hypothetical protein PF009_g8677 [Phytophthora fragariae]KAE9120599.1 hypothetical protein PF010_g7445 [Phytophthora fragariae]KAE9249434.1 hypothetical protein PF004_g3400 [Phytophthora fragariae]
MLPRSRCIKLNPISVATSTAIMDAVEKPVEQAIGGEMPERFGQIFGGWTHSTEHYLAVYGYYGTDTRPPPSTRCCR